jgi:hypothetical protein
VGTHVVLQDAQWFRGLRVNGTVSASGQGHVVANRHRYTMRSSRFAPSARRSGGSAANVRRR